MELLAPDVCLDDVYVEVGQGGSQEVIGTKQGEHGVGRCTIIWKNGMVLRERV